MEITMGITAFFSAADVILDLNVGSKRSLFQMLSAEAGSRLGRPEQELLGALQVREQLGSTALGRGVALPHARLGGDGPPVTIFARLLRPIEFEARDDEPVDLVFLVLWHEASSESFLPALSEICRALREPKMLRRLRLARSPEHVVALLHQGRSSAPGALCVPGTE
jgi:PTS system nitrogen regulatory IIA component